MQSNAAFSQPFGQPANTSNLAKEKLASILDDTDRFLREIKPPSTSDLSFEVDGVFFKARHVPKEKGARLTIWGTLGYLPYSVDSGKKRREIIAILEGARALPHVKFGVDSQMKIVAVGEYEIASPPSPDYLFLPLVRFMQEALPFIRLIGEHL